MNRRTFIRVLSSALILKASAPVKAIAALKYLDSRSFEFCLDDHIKDYLSRIEQFNSRDENDLYLDGDNLSLLYSSLSRLCRVEQTVGHGNFALISVDEAINIAKDYPSVGAFTTSELSFLEMLFYNDGAMYGFLGSKPLQGFTDRIKQNKAIKISGTGNYLYKGESLETYHKIKGRIGDELVLTSGLRSVTKQFILFLRKAAENKGNLSLASRSLAPPGYSYHGIGDFDVGQIGYGSDNFTWRFTSTDVFKKLQDAGFVNLRYTRYNTLGVRFEPWHIKVC